MDTSKLTFFDRLSFKFDDIFYFEHKTSNKQKLMFYIKNADYKKVSHFIDSGISLNFVYNYDTPLTRAVYQDDEKMVALLLKAQKNGINLPDSEYATPIVYSAQECNIKIAALLLEHGANPYIKDEIKCDAFCYAKKCNNDDLVELIGKYGVEMYQ